jgi:hypothetical protein
MKIPTDVFRLWVNRTGPSCKQASDGHQVFDGLRVRKAWADDLPQQEGCTCFIEEMSNRRLGLVAVSVEFLTGLYTEGPQMLVQCVTGLPEGAEVLDWVVSGEDGLPCQLTILYTHPTFDKVENFENIPYAKVRFMRIDQNA